MPDQSTTIQHTWQSELLSELNSVIAGFKEGREYAEEMLPRAEQLLSDIESKTLTDSGEVAKKLIDLKMNFFASKLLGGAYEDQAELANNTQPLSVEHPSEPTNIEVRDEPTPQASSTESADSEPTTAS